MGNLFTFLRLFPCTRNWCWFSELFAEQILLNGPKTPWDYFYRSHLVLKFERSTMDMDWTSEVDARAMLGSFYTKDKFWLSTKVSDWLIALFERSVILAFCSKPSSLWSFSFDLVAFFNGALSSSFRVPVIWTSPAIFWTDGCALRAFFEVYKPVRPVYWHSSWGTPPILLSDIDFKSWSALSIVRFCS